MNKLAIVIVGGLAVWLFSQKDGGATAPRAPRPKDAENESLEVLHEELMKWLAGASFGQDVKSRISSAISRMTEYELRTMYRFIFYHIRRGVQVFPGSLLYSDMKDISQKYGIFSFR